MDGPAALGAMGFYNRGMPARRYSLAIETSSRRGELALGRDDALVESLALPAQRRHHVGLVPGMERLCGAHGIGPADLAEVYVSLGPGSFTGLRVSLAAVKMLALAGGVRVVGVPTLEVVAAEAPAEHTCVGACLNHKRETVYCAVYRREGERMVRVTEAAVRTLDELRAQRPRPTVLVGDLPPARAQPRAATVWRLGRARAAAGCDADAFALEPIYGRRPEAVELWERRIASGEGV